MKWNSTITAIGSEALDPNDNIVILFDNKATDKFEMLLFYKNLMRQRQLKSLFLKRRLNYN